MLRYIAKYMNLEKSKQPTFFEGREYMLFVESWNKGTQVMSCYYTDGGSRSLFEQPKK